MYHDKRFQFEALFPLLLNNHEQIRQATTGGFLMTNRKNFSKMVDRVLNLDTKVLTDLATKINNKEQYGPSNDEEKTCFDLINDLDHAAYNVNGSSTSKKHMHNEIWATIAYLGAPTWFITFVPADNKNPICFYLADKKLDFDPDLKRIFACCAVWSHAHVSPLLRGSRDDPRRNTVHPGPSSPSRPSSPPRPSPSPANLPEGRAPSPVRQEEVSC